MEKVELHPQIFTLFPALKAHKCADYIEQTEARGYGAAPITTAFGPRLIPEIRDNTRVMVDDPSSAGDLYEQIGYALPRSWHDHSPTGLNERFRFYRYRQGQAFRWHRDGAFVRNTNQRSAFTVMVYLNDGFEGGATEFDLAEGKLRVVPRAGMALVFEHRLRHQGAPITSGTKYVLRTDAMYMRQPGR
ncbi:MAG: prolyl 4-hydroxylase [Polyangiales bacterium]|jgi:prolyl 4-hydroxylase